MGYFLTLILGYARFLIQGVGIHVVFSLGGILFLGFPTVMNASAYGLAIAQRHGFSMAISLAIGLLVGILFSLFFAFLFVRLSMDSFVVLCLASILAFEALVRSWNTLTNGVLGLSGIEPPLFLNTLGIFAAFVFFMSLVFLGIEFVLLNSPRGRAIRAFKENPLALEVLGISSAHLGQFLILFSSFCFMVAAFFKLWQFRFLTPGFVDLDILIEVFTIGILALHSGLRRLALSVLFILFFPELLRFLELPSALFAHLRLLLYSVALIFLIKRFQDQLRIPKRLI